MGEECLSVNSCGGLFYFNKEHAPEGATAYCSDCPHLDCIYKAQTIYTSETGRGFSVYFTTREKTDENILADLAKRSTIDVFSGATTMWSITRSSI